MTPEEIKEQEEAATLAAQKEQEEAEKKALELSQDPVKKALEEANKGKKTEAEKAAFSLKKNAERLKALGGDPSKILGLDSREEHLDGDEDDDKPITRGEMKKMQAQQAKQSSIQLADKLENEDERELAKVYLRDRIIPSGDPEKDLADALSLVNSVKNKQVAEEISRKITPRRHSSGAGNPGHHEENFEPSPEELTAARLAKVPVAQQKEWIQGARKGTGVVFGTAARKKKEAEANR